MRFSRSALSWLPRALAAAVLSCVLPAAAQIWGPLTLDELKAELFLRNGRGMILTSAGQLLLERSLSLVRQIEQVRDDLQSLDKVPSGAVVLGMVPTVSAVLSARVARRAVSDLPNVALRIVESYGGHLVEWLHRGTVDLSIIYGPAVDWHLDVETLGRDELVAVGPKGSGLAARAPVELSWLIGQKLALPSHSHGLRMLVERAAERKRLRVDVVVEADSFPELRNFCAVFSFPCDDGPQIRSNCLWAVAVINPERKFHYAFVTAPSTTHVTEYSSTETASPPAVGKLQMTFPVKTAPPTVSSNAVEVPASAAS